MEKNPTWVPVVALALYDNHGRWLMHLRPEGKHHGGLWEFPGGKVESGESPVNALLREIEEELGITLDRASLAPSCFAEEQAQNGQDQIVIMLYKAGPWTGLEQIQPQSLEGGGIGWFTPLEVEALQKPPLDQALARQLFG